jgi:hypothetical protein
MTDPELRVLVDALPPGRRRVYDAIAAHGPVTKNDLHRLLGKRSKKVSFSDDMRPLQEAGLVRQAGRRRLRRGSAALFAAVPAAEVAQAAASYQPPADQPESRRPSFRRRIQELRRLEVGDFALWYRARRRVVEQTQVLVEIEPMVWWEAAPAEDRLMVARELLDLQGWTERVLFELEDRFADDDLREKVAKLRETHGRTPEETKLYRDKAAKLARRLA